MEGIEAAIEKLLATGRALGDADMPYADDDLESSVDAIPVKLVVVNAEGTTEPQVFTELLAERDRRLPNPRRPSGTSTLTDLASFGRWLKRYREPFSVVWANIEQFTLTAIINEHEPVQDEDPKTVAGWRDFRAIYSMPRSPEWVSWTELDGKPMSQDAFADFIEARLDDLTSGDDAPLPTDLLTMARNLHVNSKGTFSRVVNPTNGNYSLVAKTETDTGSTQIPRAFLVAIPVFDGGERYQVECRVRFQLVNGQPQFGYTMHRRKEIERDAFNGVCRDVESNCGVPVYLGKP
jgi:uncharacterized protein YfdQ (DUF2303 family)